MGLYDFFDDDETVHETKKLIENLIKVKKTHEYSFGKVKLIHIRDDNGNKNAFRVAVQHREDEMTPDEAKILGNLLRDIFAKEDGSDGSDKT